jgi:hypothetical protein
MQLDPAKLYAELKPMKNVVVRVFRGEEIPERMMTSWRRIVEIPEGVEVRLGDIYANGTFRSPITLALIQERLAEAVQTHLDSTAQQHGYDSIFTAVTYAEESAVPEFQAEGQAMRAWRSLVWAHCYQALADVQNQLRTIPTEAELVAELPTLVLP